MELRKPRLYKKIRLTQGRWALVDSEDYGWLSQWKWYAVNWGGRWYAVRNKPERGGLVRMHREIARTSKELVTDHQNGKTLDNRRHNLLPVTNAQNVSNRTRLNSNNTQGVAGVYYESRNSTWYYQITMLGKVYTEGGFLSKKAAAKARADRRYNIGVYGAKKPAS